MFGVGWEILKRRGRIAMESTGPLAHALTDLKLATMVISEIPDESKKEMVATITALEAKLKEIRDGIRLLYFTTMK